MSVVGPSGRGGVNNTLASLVLNSDDMFDKAFEKGVRETTTSTLHDGTAGNTNSVLIQSQIQ